MISDYDFSVRNGGSPRRWVEAFPGGGELIDDAGDPESPPKVYKTYWFHNARTGNGSVPHLDIPEEASELYIAYTWKPSNPFTGWSNNNNKLLVVVEKNGSHIWNHMKSLTTQGGPYYPALFFGGGGIYADNSHLYPYLIGPTEVRLGAWHRMEIYLKRSSTPTSRDGIARFWFDGILQGQVTKLNTVGGFVDVHITQSWDNIEPNFPNAYDEHRFGHIRVAIGGGTAPPPPPPPTAPPPPPPAAPGTVIDLSAAVKSSASVDLTFTEVANGVGQAASYVVRYSDTGGLWGNAVEVTQGSCSAPLAGTAIGAKKTCSVTGLSPDRRYEFQLVAYRGTLNVDAVFGGLSNVVSAATLPAARSTDVNGDGATTAADVQLAINQSLGIAACGSGDVDGDGACDITDVQRVVNAALGAK